MAPDTPPRTAAPVKLIAKPIPHGERGVLARALAKAQLPVDDIDQPGRLFWRFESTDQVPLGFGGLEVHGNEALLRSLLTLPPAQRRGVGRGMVAALEIEALAAGAQRIWLLTLDVAPFFAHLGYTECAREEAPAAIQSTDEWRLLCPATAVAMCKQLPRPTCKPPPRRARKRTRRLRAVK
jgi:N-acetylglutamate synthase-like GNAT family acetyltransferase